MCFIGYVVMDRDSASNWVFLQVCINWRKSDLPAREKAMLEFALAISQADDITDDHFKKLEVHGFNQEDARDIAAISAFYAMSNCLAHFVNLVPNKEFYFMGRTSDVKEWTCCS